MIATKRVCGAQHLSLLSTLEQAGEKWLGHGPPQAQRESRAEFTDQQKPRKPWAYHCRPEDR